MKSSAQKYSEAIAALTHRLNTWGVDDPETKAREFMHDLTCQGWRTIPLEVTPPRPGRPADEQVRAEALAAARAALRPPNTNDTPTERKLKGSDSLGLQ